MSGEEKRAKRVAGQKRSGATMELGEQPLLKNLRVEEEERDESAQWAVLQLVLNHMTRDVMASVQRCIKETLTSSIFDRENEEELVLGNNVSFSILAPYMTGVEDTWLRFKTLQLFVLHLCYWAFSKKQAFCGYYRVLGFIGETLGLRDGVGDERLRRAIAYFSRGGIFDFPGHAWLQRATRRVWSPGPLSLAEQDSLLNLHHWHHVACKNADELANRGEMTWEMFSLLCHHIMSGSELRHKVGFWCKCTPSMFSFEVANRVIQNLDVTSTSLQTRRTLLMCLVLIAESRNYYSVDDIVMFSCEWSDAHWEKIFFMTARMPKDNSEDEWLLSYLWCYSQHERCTERMRMAAMCFEGLRAQTHPQEVERELLGLYDAYTAGLLTRGCAVRSVVEHAEGWTFCPMNFSHLAMQFDLATRSHQPELARLTTNVPDRWVTSYGLALAELGTLQPEMEKLKHLLSVAKCHADLCHTLELIEVYGADQDDDDDICRTLTFAMASVSPNIVLRDAAAAAPMTCNYTVLVRNLMAAENSEFQPFVFKSKADVDIDPHGGTVAFLHVSPRGIQSLPYNGVPRTIAWCDEKTRPSKILPALHSPVQPTVFARNAGMRIVHDVHYTLDWESECTAFVLHGSQVYEVGTTHRCLELASPSQTPAAMFPVVQKFMQQIEVRGKVPTRLTLLNNSSTCVTSCLGLFVIRSLSGRCWEEGRLAVLDRMSEHEVWKPLREPVISTALSMFQSLLLRPQQQGNKTGGVRRHIVPMRLPGLNYYVQGPNSFIDASPAFQAAESMLPYFSEEEWAFARIHHLFFNASGSRDENLAMSVFWAQAAVTHDQTSPLAENTLLHAFEALLFAYDHTLRPERWAELQFYIRLAENAPLGATSEAGCMRPAHLCVCRRVCEHYTKFGSAEKDPVVGAFTWPLVVLLNLMTTACTEKLEEMALKCIRAWAKQYTWSKNAGLQRTGDVRVMADLAQRGCGCAGPLIRALLRTEIIPHFDTFLTGFPPLEQLRLMLNPATVLLGTETPSARLEAHSAVALKKAVTTIDKKHYGPGSNSSVIIVRRDTRTYGTTINTGLLIEKQLGALVKKMEFTWKVVDYDDLPRKTQAEIDTFKTERKEQMLAWVRESEAR